MSPLVQRGPGRPGVDQGAGPVVVETPGLHDRDRALRQRRDLRPVAALGRHDALLGQDEGGQGQGAGRGGVVGRAGQDRVSPGRVALQQVGDALGVQHRRPVRARRAQPVPGDPRIAPHLGDAVTAQDRAQVGQRALHRAAVGQDPRRGGAFRRGGPALGLARLAEQREDQRAVHGDRAEVLGRRHVPEPLHPAQHGLDAPAGPDGLLRAPGPGGPPGRSPRPPGRARSRSPASRSPRTTRPPGNADRRPGRAPAAAVPPAAAPGAGGGSGTTRGGGRAGRPGGCWLSSRSRTRPDPFSPRIASHSGPHIRSRTDVRVRNDASASETRSSSSERR